MPDNTAQDRHDAHSGDPSQRILNEKHDQIGLFGEELFAARYGVEVDRSISRSGDGGFDFKIGVYTFDVKTSTHIPRMIEPTYLKIDIGKARKDVIYVLALYDQHTKSGYLMGFEYGDLVPQHSCQMNFGNGLVHAMAHDRLRSMGDLDKLIEAEKIRLENHGTESKSTDTP